MTITVNFVTVADSLAGLQIPGVTVLGLDQIPEDAKNIVPCLIPRPENFITDITFEKVSYGAEDVAKMNMTYTLNYIYLHAPIGAGGGLLAVYGAFMTALAKILKAIFGDSSPSGAVDMALQGISGIGPIEDPAGNQYHGVEIALRVLEHVQ